MVHPRCGCLSAFRNDGVNSESLDLVARFFIVCFHLDWRDEFADEDAALAHFARGKTGRELLEVATALDQVAKNTVFAQPGRFNPSWALTLRDLNCYFEGASGREQQWLADCAGRLRKLAS